MILEKIQVLPDKFLYIDPLKQGLKQEIYPKFEKMVKYVFIHRSIKTRIETINNENNLEFFGNGFYT